jgi:hypothetical protein
MPSEGGITRTSTFKLNKPGYKSADVTSFAVTMLDMDILAVDITLAKGIGKRIRSGRGWRQPSLHKTDPWESVISMGSVITVAPGQNEYCPK